MNSIEQCAKVCHEANRGYCEAIGDMSQVSWEEAEQWQRDSAIAGVKYALDNPDATPEDQHDAWMSKKFTDGWIYGKVKNADATPPTHPCLVQYANLPVEQRAKDHIFRAIVRAMQ